MFYLIQFNSGNASQNHSQAKLFESLNEIAITTFPIKHG